MGRAPPVPRGKKEARLNGGKELTNRAAELVGGMLARNGKVPTLRLLGIALQAGSALDEWLESRG